MKEKLNFLLKFGSKSILKWALIVGFGTFITLTFCTILLFRNAQLGGGGHGNAIAFVINIFATNWAAGVLIFGAPFFTFAYFILANKYVFTSILGNIWKEKGQSLILDKSEEITRNLLENNTLDPNGNAAHLKATLLKGIGKNTSGGKWLKRIMRFVLKRLNLGEFNNITNSNEIVSLVSNKVNNFVTESTKPSLKWVFILFTVQIVLFVISY